METPREWSTDSGDAWIPDDVPETEWWAALGDSELERLIRRAVAENPSLEAAEARLRATRSLVGTEEARLRPRVRASATHASVELSERLPILEDFMARGLVDESQELFSAGFDAAWEIDVFGGARRRVEAAEARAGATRAGLRDARLTLVAEVARNYFHFRNRQRQVQLLDRQHVLSESLAEWARARLRTGVGGELAVADAEARVAGIQARLPAARAAADASVYRLAVLCHEAPAELRDRLSAYRPPPSPPDLVPAGLPGSLLRRRPDIRRAERALAAATAGVGARTADLYPQFFLTGSVGRQAQTFTELAESESGGWLIAPAIQWNLYTGGGTRAGIEAARAKRDAAAAAYRHGVMRAVGEVETRLSAYAAAFETRRELDRLVARREKGVRVAEEGFKAGVLDKGTVRKAELALTEAESELARARGEVLIALAALNKALGGGWSFPGDSGA